MQTTFSRGLALLIGLALCIVAHSQDVAVKTNLLYDAATTPNGGVEFKFVPKWSLELMGGYNNWTFSDEKRWKNWYVMPEIRRWLCDVWDGHFFALHVFGGQYNIGGVKGLPNFLGTDLSQLADTRVQGWMAGAGIAYGYDWMLGEHWNLEAEIGIGWAYTRYDQFNCLGCGKKIATNRPHNYFGPTKASIVLVYVF